MGQAQRKSKRPQTGSLATLTENNEGGPVLTTTRGSHTAIPFHEMVCKLVLERIAEDLSVSHDEKSYKRDRHRLRQRIEDFLHPRNNSWTAIRTVLSHIIDLYSADRDVALLVKACFLTLSSYPWDSDVDFNRANKYGNTALHLVAAMREITWNNLQLLFSHLLDIGIKMSKRNNDGCNVLHILSVEKMEPKFDEEGDVWFEYADEFTPTDDWRGKLDFFLDHLFPAEEQAQLTVLLNQGDRNGNTIMHLCILATWYYMIPDKDILGRVLGMGGLLNVANRFGHFPIHYAFNHEVFKFLLEEGSDCCSRSHHAETPVLLIMKRLLRPIYTSPPPDSALHEINYVFGDKQWHSHSYQVDILHGLIDIIKMEEVRGTLLIPDDNGISPVTVLLTAIRMKAYSCLHLNQSIFYTVTPNVLLGILLRVAGKSDVQKSWKKKLPLFQQNNWNNKSVLHVLLDMGNSVHSLEDLTFEETHDILQCLERLLKEGADINSVDSKGETVMHLVCRQYPACPPFFRQCIAVLMEYNPNLDIRDDFGVTVHDLTSRHKELDEMNLKLIRKVNCKATRHTQRALSLANTQSASIKVVGNYRYSPDSFIKRGSFGAVYVAIKDEFQHKKSKVITCRAFALKKAIVDSQVVDPKDFEREVNLLTNLPDECRDFIVSYHETILTAESYFIVLELMDGDLRWFLQDDETKKRLVKNSERMANGALNILKGLVFLHDNQFIHRDLTPSNILVMLFPSLLFKIADFGLAKNLSASCPITSTLTGNMLGTRTWMAPELLSCESTKHTKESDIFALGLVFHYFFSLGLHPAEGETSLPMHDIEKNIAQMKLSMDKDLSREATALLTTMLAKDSTQRKSASELQKHVFFWSDKKKTEFLRAVGNEEEAVSPLHKHPNSTFEKCLQNTDFGKILVTGDPSKGIPACPWNTNVPGLYKEMVMKKSNYRTNCVLDLLRFIRNAYAHKEERSAAVKTKLEQNVFLKMFPTLVIEVYDALNNNGFLARNGIKEVLI